MSVLLAVVDSGSLSGAGRKLGMPLATISRKVSDLEGHLGARLLIRSSRRLSLTDAGRGYVAACQRILEQVDEAERAAAGEYRAPRGDLVIAAPVVFGRLHVLPAVTAFLVAYPDIAIRMILDDRIAHLLDEHVDVALRIGELQDSSHVAIKVGEVRRVVCASPGYLSIRGTPATPEALAGHDSIAFTTLTSVDGWSFRDGGLDRMVAIQPRLVVSTAEAAIDAAIAGLGVTRFCLTRSPPRGSAGRLQTVLEAFEPPSGPSAWSTQRRGCCR